MADRPTDACLRGRRAYEQGSSASENPYVSSEELAMAWDHGWQAAQTLDEFSAHVRQHKSRFAPDPELREELWRWIQRRF